MVQEFQRPPQPPANRRHIGLFKLISLCAFCACSKWHCSNRTTALATFLKGDFWPLIGRSARAQGEPPHLAPSIGWRDQSSHIVFYFCYACAAVSAVTAGLRGSSSSAFTCVHAAGAPAFVLWRVRRLLPKGLSSLGKKN